MKRIRKRRDIKIEHYEARNQENQLLYGNLLAVCTGDDASKKEKGKVDPAKFTCDSMKKNQKLSIDPQSENDMNTIYYDNQGKIYSTVKEYQEDLDQILNLNDKNKALNRCFENYTSIVPQKIRKENFRNMWGFNDGI